jgi:hypothetical protein
MRIRQHLAPCGIPGQPRSPFRSRSLPAPPLPRATATARRNARHPACPRDLPARLMIIFLLGGILFSNRHTKAGFAAAGHPGANLFAGRLSYATVPRNEEKIINRPAIERARRGPARTSPARPTSHAFPAAFCSKPDRLLLLPAIRIVKPAAFRGMVGSSLTLRDLQLARSVAFCGMPGSLLTSSHLGTPLPSLPQRRGAGEEDSCNAIPAYPLPARGRPHSAVALSQLICYTHLRAPNGAVCAPAA